MKMVKTSENKGDKGRISFQEEEAGERRGRKCRSEVKVGADAAVNNPAGVRLCGYAAEMKRLHGQITVTS